MKIAVPAVEADLDAEVAGTMSTCRYLLVVDAGTMTFEVVRAPSEWGRAGLGVQMVSRALSLGAMVFLTRHLSPRLAETLRANGFAVVTGAEGTVREAVERYLRQPPGGEPQRPRPVLNALAKSLRQLTTMVPTILGVVLLVGLFKSFISRQTLAVVFSGVPSTDAVWGACFGSILAGHPVNSYVIGRALQDGGVSLFAVAAVLYTWVSVGLVQLPAEVSALGARFALTRNAMAFALAIPVALVTVLLAGWLS